jgi:hypothetical protein
MSTAATPIPAVKATLTTNQMRSLKAIQSLMVGGKEVGDRWRQIALASPVSSKSVRAIASAFAMLVDGEGEISPIKNVKTGEDNKGLTVADVKYNVGCHSREKAEYIIENSPSLVRDMFSGADPRKLRTIYLELKAKKKFGKHEEPLNAERPRETATVFELKYELYELLTNDDLEKVLKYALARLHPDNKETGNETKYKRLGEIWGKIKAVEGV